MLALQLGTTVMWIAVCVASAWALLAVVVGISRAAGARPSRKLVTRAALAVGAAAIVVPIGAIVVYTQFLNDPEPAFDNDDLASLVGGVRSSTSTTGSFLAAVARATDRAAAATTVPSDEPVACAADSESSEPVSTALAGDGALDGEWLVSEGSEFGYRIPEVLAGVETEAVGRGSEIEGSFTALGDQVVEACFVVQVASITSDERMRDGAFNGRIMQTSEFPTATFALTSPISLDELPEVGGDPVTVEVAGDLTLHGVTRPVKFGVTVQVGHGGDDGRIVGVLGQIPVTFADYDIANPSGGPAQVGDDGTLEFLLAFEQA